MFLPSNFLSVVMDSIKQVKKHVENRILSKYRNDYILSFNVKICLILLVLPKLWRMSLAAQRAFSWPSCHMLPNTGFFCPPSQSGTSWCLGNTTVTRTHRTVFSLGQSPMLCSQIKLFRFVTCYSTAITKWQMLKGRTLLWLMSVKKKSYEKDGCVPLRALRCRILFGHCSQTGVCMADQRAEMS